AAVAGAKHVGAGAQRRVGPGDDLLEHVEVDQFEVLDVDAADGGGVRAAAPEEILVGADTVEDVDDEGLLAGGEASRRRVALPTARVAVVVAPEADGAALDHRRLARD